MDNQFRLPGTQIRLGWDPLMGLVPGIGDLLTALVSIYIVRQAYQIGVPKRLVMQMAANVAVDALAGTLPVLGDFFDVIWKSNSRNVQILEDWLQRQSTERSGRGC